MLVPGLKARRSGHTPAQRPLPNDFAHLSDEALVAMVARGDDDAFAELYDRYDRLAYGLCRRILRDETLAQDAVQDAFLTIWRSRREVQLGARAQPASGS